MHISNKPMLIYFVYKGSEIVYIGQTIQSLAQRRGKHTSEAHLGRGSILGAGIRKHGVEKFEFKKHSIHYCQKDLDSAERHYIAKYRPRYNIQEGGKKNVTPWNKGKKETRPEVLSNIAKGAANRIQPKRGKYSKAHKEKISASLRKRMVRQFTCEQNNQTYSTKVEAAEALGIKPQRISDILCETHPMSIYRGLTFKYVD